MTDTEQIIFQTPMMTPTMLSARHTMKHGHVITDRDVTVFRKLLEGRAMTTFQIADVFTISRTSSRLLLRLKFLTSIGMIGRIEQAGFYSEYKKPYVYVRRREGLQLISQAKHIDIEELITQYN